MRPIKNVTERHLEAYRLWKIHQNHAKVADELGVHVDTVANWSSFFEWRRKLAEDIANGDGNTMAIVAGFRKNAIVVTDLIQGWTVRLAKMHQTIIGEDRSFTEEENLLRDRYISAIKTFDPRAMQNLLAYLKASYQFDLGTGGGREEVGELPDRPGGEAGINFRGPTLVMFGPGKGGENGKEKLFQLQGTGSKSRTRLIGHGAVIQDSVRSIDGSGIDGFDGHQEVCEGSGEDSGGDNGRSGPKPIDKQGTPATYLDRTEDSPWA